jgi:hypothetical protein
MPRKRKPAPTTMHIGDLVQHIALGTTGTLRALHTVPATDDTPATLRADIAVFGRIVTCWVRELRRVDRIVLYRC